jgi:hypothetical protein
MNGRKKVRFVPIFGATPGIEGEVPEDMPIEQAIRLHYDVRDSNGDPKPLMIHDKEGRALHPGTPSKHVDEAYFAPLTTGGIE